MSRVASSLSEKLVQSRSPSCVAANAPIKSAAIKQQ
jgi:hypothetical protein